MDKIAIISDIHGNITALNAVLDDIKKQHLYRQFSLLWDEVVSENFTPQIVYDGEKPVEFSSIELTQYRNLQVVKYGSISEVLDIYYSQKDFYLPYFYLYDKA